MRNKVSAASASHYVWGAVCDGWHLVRGEALSVIEERMLAGAQEQRHSHTKARQFFYVLEGELMLEVEGEVHCLGPRQGLEIAPGERHQALCASNGECDTEVRFLVVSAPPGQGDRVIDGEIAVG